MQSGTQNLVQSARTEVRIVWPVCWSAVWVGALAALAAALIFGLIGTALGATAARSLASWSSVTRFDVGAMVIGSFFTFVAGGWVAAKIAGTRLSEPAILHGVIAWLAAVPLLTLLLALGAGSAYGGWYGGIVGASPLLNPSIATGSPDAVRNTALAALTTILIGLMGAVIGGWMACGEPMTFTHHRKRNASYASMERTSP
jgi:hypothetical protein